MEDLRVYGRRPAAMVRHRHGGFNATFPMNCDTVAEQVSRIRSAKAESAAAEQPAPAVEGFEASNVLSFQSRADRAKRGQTGGRFGGRPAPYRD